MKLRKDRKFIRQNEAKKRNLEWLKLTDEEKISYLDKHGFTATKQRAKILSKG